ncbi:two-component regulator propeller domain-containing protein [Aurantibacillus circumpalustris]|uniref:two-component regulator propeller domain-containing protein n=1 Tax=Aurantibacillus circumpalustris TaxID=3036359 RepID=UPI00295AC804|nr:two-component regulator propeller domain-containing protein [Aurantibacillus circumpalustris]
MLKLIKITLVLFSCSTQLFSQLQIKNHFSFSGKKNTAVNVITQDFTGYLWLGTNEGLFQFDGKFSTEISKKFPVLKKEISALFVDSRETIWVGTKDGKIYFIKKNSVDSLVFPSKPNTEKITSFCELKAGICIGTYGNGIYCLSKGNFTHLTTEKGLSDNVIYKLTGDEKNTLWAGGDAGISEIKSIFETPQFYAISDKNGLPDNIVRDITYKSNKLLISMQDSGVCYYNLDKRKIERIPFFNNWALGPVINAFSENQNNLIIATEKKGLLQINKGVISVYNYQQYIFESSIKCAFIDREKQIWLASKNGISHLTERRYNFINASKGLVDDKILALAIDNDNAIWIGTTKGISKIMNDAEGKTVITKIQDLDKYTISCAIKAPDGNIWFGTYGNGIIIMSSETKNSVIINSKEDGLANDNISNIYFSDKNTVYISTLGGGLVQARVEFEGMKKIFTIEKTYTESEGLGSNYVYASITDNSSKLFLATDGGGLQVFENNKFTDLTKKFKLNSNTVFSLCKDKNNTIWASSNSDGIVKYDGKSLKCINLTKGLRDEQPQQLVSSQNTIYAVNSRGIDKINCSNDSISYYDLYEGELEPNLNAIFFYDNKIYSGTNSGVLTFRTNSESSDSIKPIAFIKSFFLQYKPFPIDSIFEFKYNQNNIGFNFDGIWLKNPGKLFFRYKLHGLEDDWLYADEGKTINYNNLNPGNYTFMLQVKNEEEIWSEPVTHSIIILTPIWKRWWFWLTVISIGSFGIYLFVKYRLEALQRENALLERRVKERTFQIEKQSKIIESKNIELEQLSLVASKTDNVVLILDANGKLEYVNESFTKLNKLSMEDLTKTYGETIYELSNNANIREIIQDAVSNKRSVNYESLNKKVESGTETWESSTLTPIFDEQGILKKIIIIDTDVSIRKKHEQIILQKNKDITDSISYARKIQHAILPSDELLKTYLPNSFVLYMTKDIVSGDFYWFTHFEDSCIIAAVDCTGHGVPGAFMSLIGHNQLNRIVNEEKITDPKNILLELNNGVLGVLHKNESESKDGMDIAICKINYKKNTLEYSGAMRPLWIINKSGELTEIKADKIPIGTKQKDRDETIVYTTHTIDTNRGDTFYIFTDGYADQFGGTKDKKYSTGKFKELLIKNSTLDFSSQEKNIKKEHLEWKDENEQVDDILIIGFNL